MKATLCVVALWMLLFLKANSLIPDSISLQQTLGEGVDVTEYELDSDDIHVQGDAYVETVNGTDYFYLNKLECDSVGAGVVKTSLVQQLGILTSNTSIQFELYAGGNNESSYGKSFKWNLGASSGCLLRKDDDCRGIQIEFNEQNGTQGVYVYRNGTLMAHGANGKISELKNKWAQIHIDMYSHGSSNVHSMYVYYNSKSLFKSEIFFYDGDLNTGASTSSGLSNKMTFFALTCDEDDETKCYDNHIVKNIKFFTTYGGNSTQAPSISPAPTLAPTAAPTVHCRRQKVTQYSLDSDDFSTSGDGYIDGEYFVLNENKFGSGGGVKVRQVLVDEFDLVDNNVSIGFDAYAGGSANDTGAYMSWSYGTSDKCLERSYYDNEGCGGIIVAFVTTDTEEFYKDKHKGIVVYANGSFVAYTNLTDTYYENWVYVNIKTYAHDNDDSYHGEVYVNDELLIDHFPFTKGDMNEVNKNNASVSNKILFYGQTCSNGTGGTCADGHVITDVVVNVTYWKCPGSGSGGSSSTSAPTVAVTKAPSKSSSTAAPTVSVTKAPTVATEAPSVAQWEGYPTKSPTKVPTTSPTPSPTHKPKPTRSPTPAPTKATGPTATPTKATSPTVSPTLSPTKKPHVPPTMHPTAAPTTASPTSTYEWSFYIDHLELMFDAYKKGHHIHLTDNKKDQFGLAFIPPKLADLLGYGSYGVNLTFNVTFGSASDGCSGVGFVVDYGTRISCLFAAEASSHDDITDPTCDGISLGLISDSSASGIYVAKQDSIQYAGSSTSFEDKQTEIRMEYTHDSTHGYDYMKFYLDGEAVTDAVQFSTDYIAQGTRIPPKVTFVATTTDCSEAHALSAFEGRLGLEMEKVLTLTDQQLMLELFGQEHKHDRADLHALYDPVVQQQSFLGVQSSGFLIVIVAVVAVLALFVRNGLINAISGRITYSPL